MRFFLGAILATLPLLASAPAQAAALTSADIASALAFAEQQAVNTMSALGGDYTAYPRSGPSSAAWTRIVGADDWTSGF